MELFIAMRKPSFSGVRLSVELLESRELLNAALTGNLVLGFKPGTVPAFTESSKIAVAEGVTLQPTSIANVFEVRGAGANAAVLIQQIAKDPNVRYVEPEEFVHTDLLPNDPKFQDGTLWGLN